jgi:uncharacterized membrane protein YhaH (DUF805 family)
VFKGRASRPEYWWFYLFILLGNLVVQFAIHAVPTLGRSLWILWAALTFIPSLAVASRRLHDTGHSFWWYSALYLPLVPIMILAVTKPPWLKGSSAALLVFVTLLLAFFGLVIWLLILMCRKGDTGPNRYGDPAPMMSG